MEATTFKKGKADTNVLLYSYLCDFCEIVSPFERCGTSSEVLGKEQTTAGRCTPAAKHTQDVLFCECVAKGFKSLLPLENS